MAGKEASSDPVDYRNLRFEKSALLQVEDVWNDNRTWGTSYHGEFHARLSIHKVSSGKFVAQQAVESSGRTLFLTPELFDDVPGHCTTEEFQNFHEACEWLRESELIQHGHLAELFEKEVLRFNSTGRSGPTLTPWSDRKAHELFETKLVFDPDDTMWQLLQEWHSPRWGFPHSLNDLRFLIGVDVSEFSKRNLSIDSESLSQRVKDELLPEVEARFIELLSG